jgi:hypothetical protein
LIISFCAWQSGDRDTTPLPRATRSSHKELFEVCRYPDTLQV